MAVRKIFYLILALSAISLQLSHADNDVLGINLSGSIRARLESWDWYETSAANNDYTFGAALFRFTAGQQKPRFDWQGELAVPVLFSIPDDAIAPAPQGQLGFGGSYFAGSGSQNATLILKQGFLRFKGIAGDLPSTLRLGRFEFSDGLEVIPSDATLATLKREKIGQRMVGPFGFTHIQRSYDGIHYARNTKTDNITVLGARITQGVFQLDDANNELDVDLFYGSYTRPFTRTTSNNELRVFALHYHDGRLVLKTDNRPESIRQADKDKIRLTSLGAHYLAAIKTNSGIADLLFWGVFQFGNWGELDQSSGAIAIEGGYQLQHGWKPWLRAGYFLSSGDNDPADDNHNTFFQGLPTPRIYSRFPFYNLMNLQDLFVEFRLKPHPKVALRSDIRFLDLSNSNDLWYLGGGAFQKQTFGYVGRPSNGEHDLGTLFDISADFTISKQMSLTGYVGVVRGGDVQSLIYPEGGAHPGAHYIYFEFTQSL